MNIDNITEGLIVKNYKEMCSLLNQTVKGGDSKKAQLKEWSTYFNYEKDGNKFVIKEIYDTQLEKEDGRKILSIDDKRYNSVYGDDIQQLLLLLIASSSEENEIILPTTVLLNKLSMTNKNYSLARKNQDKLSEILEIDEKYINEFYGTTHSNLKSSLESSMNSLRRRALITWTTVRMVCKKVLVTNYNELDEIVIDDMDKISYSIKEEYSIADKEQDLIILEAERLTLKDMGYETIGQAIRDGRIKDFYTSVYKIIQSKANIKYYFNAYQIKFNKDLIIDALEPYGEDLNHIRIQLNNKVKEKLLDNAIARQEKVEDETKNVIGIPKLKKNQKLRIEKDYLDNIQLLINTVINMTAKDIRNKLKVD